MSDNDDRALCLGISATTAKPLPDVTADGLKALYERESQPDPERKILERRAEPGGAAFGVISEISDPNDLSQSGWGLVLARDSDPEILKALKPLLDLRKQQAGTLFRVFEGGGAPAPDEPAVQWLARRGTRLDVVDPFKGVPYFLLLVGSPESLPFELQYTLDIYWAVGRLHFDRIDDYARYAEGVVAYESAVSLKTARQVALFATRHDFDDATKLFAAKVAAPLADRAGPYGALGSRQGFGLRSFVGDQATKANLTRILAGESEGGLPALLFSGTHGMECELGDPRQPQIQGAPLCQDWPDKRSVGPEHWFAAADLPPQASLAGLVHFAFACHSAGYPRDDNFARTANGPRPIAERPGLAPLPRAMLSHPGGSALACLGHIDRAWSYGFESDRGTSQVQGMRDALARLLRGDRIGHATDQLNIRWAALSSDLSDLLQDLKYGADVDDRILANRWIARDDARNYAILGDPAVRLRPEAMAPAS